MFAEHFMCVSEWSVCVFFSFSLSLSLFLNFQLNCMIFFFSSSFIQNFFCIEMFEFYFRCNQRWSSTMPFTIIQNRTTAKTKAFIETHTAMTHRKTIEWNHHIKELYPNPNAFSPLNFRMCSSSTKFFFFALPIALPRMTTTWFRNCSWWSVHLFSFRTKKAWTLLLYRTDTEKKSLLRFFLLWFVRNRLEIRHFGHNNSSSNELLLITRYKFHM